MKKAQIHKTLTIFIASVWLINGLICKLLNLAPRHQQIVEQILETENSRQLTILIGVSEIIMAMWILSRYRSKVNAMLQMIIVAVMNILEFALVPELLLWGKINSLFAFLFICIVGYNEFSLNK